jgi:hypothetical protein
MEEEQDGQGFTIGLFIAIAIGIAVMAACGAASLAIASLILVL